MSKFYIALINALKHYVEKCVGIYEECTEGWDDLENPRKFARALFFWITTIGGTVALFIFACWVISLICGFAFLFEGALKGIYIASMFMFVLGAISLLVSDLAIKD